MHIRNKQKNTLKYYQIHASELKLSDERPISSRTSHIARHRSHLWSVLQVFSFFFLEYDFRGDTQRGHTYAHFLSWIGEKHWPARNVCHSSMWSWTIRSHICNWPNNDQMGSTEIGQPRVRERTAKSTQSLFQCVTFERTRKINSSKDCTFSDVFFFVCCRTNTYAWMALRHWREVRHQR